MFFGYIEEVKYAICKVGLKRFERWLVGGEGVYIKDYALSFLLKNSNL